MGTKLTLGAALFSAWTIAACGGDGGTDNNPNLVLAKTATASGDGQTAVVASVLPQKLRVVLTCDGAPRPDATINWSAINGSVSPATSITDPNGVATATWTLGLAAGPQTARAQFVGATGSPQLFSATGLAGAPFLLAKVDGDNQVTTAGTPFPAPLRARVADAFGNGIPGVTVTWTVTSGPVVLVDPGAATDGQGIASKTATAGATPGNAVLTATTAAVPAASITYGLTVSAAIRDVTLGDIFFRSNTNNTQNPAVDTVQVGQTVRWTNTTGGHTVRSLGNPSFPNSGSLSTVGATYSHAFTAAGTYQYDCSIHGSQMTGTIVVQ
ncbi:MAG: Ig-like domain-containing protein [Gemmatimonadota bacterium]|nr:Ig-like domain-containing protein [Gemmatimonadota bacterium]